MRTKKSIWGVILLGAAVSGATCFLALRSGDARPAHGEQVKNKARAARAEVVPLRCAMKPEQRLGLAFTERTSAGISSQPDKDSRQGETTLSGEMKLRVLSVEGEDGARVFTLAGVLSDAEVTAAGERLDELCAALAEPVLFQMNESCQVTRFAAPPSMVPNARNQWRMALKLLEAAVPETGGRRSWTTTQTDGLGTFSATYHRADLPGAGVELKRSRLRYERLHKDAGGRLAAKVMHSRARLEVAPGGLVTAASIDERVVMQMDRRPAVDVRTTIEAHATEVSGEDAFFTRGFDPSRYVFGAADVLDEVVDLLPYGDRDPIEGLAGRSTAQVVSAVEALLAKEPQPDYDGAAVLLVQYLRLDPKHADAVLAKVRSSEADGTRSMLLLGLQLAGGSAAHRALREAIGDRGLSGADRMRAVAALAGVPDPDNGSVDALLALRSGRDSQQAEAAQLGIGVMAKNPRLDADSKARLLGALSDDLAGARDASARGTALAAAGNAADPSLRDEVAPFMNDPDPVVQAEAYASLAKMNALPPPSELLETLSEAQAPRLKATLGEALQGVTLGEAELARCMEMLQGQPSEDTRAILIELLGAAAKSDAAAKAALVQQAHLEKDRALLTLLGRHLQPSDLM